jgi:hypothetical protein
MGDCLVENFDLVGNGFCNAISEYNNAACNWDGGDWYVPAPSSPVTQLTRSFDGLLCSALTPCCLVARVTTSSLSLSLSIYLARSLSLAPSRSLSLALSLSRSPALSLSLSLSLYLYRSFSLSLSHFLSLSLSLSFSRSLSLPPSLPLSLITHSLFRLLCVRVSRLCLCSCYLTCDRDAEYECGYNANGSRFVGFGNCLNNETCSGVDYTRLADAICDADATYNNAVCGWDGGDCWCVCASARACVRAFVPTRPPSTSRPRSLSGPCFLVC